MWPFLVLKVNLGEIHSLVYSLLLQSLDNVTDKGKSIPFTKTYSWCPWRLRSCLSHGALHSKAQSFILLHSTSAKILLLLEVTTMALATPRAPPPSAMSWYHFLLVNLQPFYWAWVTYLVYFNCVISGDSLIFTDNIS